jgi:hypothetical protein
MKTRARAGLISLAAVLFTAPLSGQRAASFGTCRPRSQRTGNELGCFIIVDHAVGVLGPAKVFWHISSLANAKSAVKSRPRGGIVVDAYGRHWLMEIDTSRKHNDRAEVATIGPLPVTPGTAYSAVYMEASMTPGMKSAIHRHSGPEAWYTLTGETCLETPTGSAVGKAGGPPVIIPGGPPMELTATGTQIRRSLVLILHDSHRPPTSIEREWKPRGLCTAQLKHDSAHRSR